MQVTSLRIRNVFQHRDVEKEIKGNLIGIVGPNGSGKSNLINALQYTLTGEVPSKRKDQLLRWGAEGGGEGTVNIVHNGVNGTITRSVSGGKTGFKLGKDVDLTGITRVNSGIIEHLGLDRDIARTVFVPQSELHSILFDQAGKRELAFQRMCGIGDAAKIQRQLGQVITQKFPPLADFDEQIALGESEMHQMEQRVTELNYKLSTIASALSQVDEESIRQQRIQYQELGQVAQTAQQAAARMGKLQTALQADKGALERIRDSTRGITLKAITDQINEAHATLNTAQEYQSRLTAWKTQQDALENLGGAPVNTDELERLSADLASMRQATGAIQGNLGMYRDLLTSLNKAGGVEGAEAPYCPVCGSAITDYDVLRTRLKTKVEECQADLNTYDVDSANRNYETLNTKYTQWSTRRSLLSKQEAQARQLLDAADQVDADVSTLQVEIKRMREIRDEMSQMFDQESELRIRIDVNTAQYTEIEAEYKEAVNRVLSFEIATRDQNRGLTFPALEEVAVKGLQEADTAMQAIQAQRREEAGIKGSLNEIDARMKTLYESLKVLKRRRSQQGTYNEVRTTVERIREWLHYSNGPHALAASIMEELTGNVNTFLQQLNAPFAALIDETGLGYKCPFIDGRPMPEDGAPAADELSNGQKTLLAVAFRLANYCMFANKQGLLSLDEPSAWLDEANIANFCTLLGKVKEVAQAMNLQIWMSTHERSVLPYCDTVIDFYE